MRLKRLILQGFKSFKDRQVIGFDDGVTGIVGPNGCGKSNIVDALFWVMGGQSAKHLRGQSMKDLIFAGSSQYAPCPFAEVTLVLDNPEGKLIHIGRQVSGPSEIQLTRKLYRDGETEFRINGEPCRLRDIQEVFMDTGSGAKSYSVIAQGEIDRLVQSKPLDRRQIVEEVAGITKFKMRRRESMRKIEVTRQNLGRLQDLQGEIEKHLSLLKGQSDKARRAKQLKENVRRLELVVASHKAFDQLRAIRKNGENLHQSKLDRETWSIRREQLEISLERERHQRDQSESKLENMQREYNVLSSGLMVAEEKLKHLESRLEERKGELALREREVDAADSEIAERKAKREHLLGQKRKWENKREQSAGPSQGAGDLEQLREKLSKEEQLLAQLAEKLDHSRRELAQAEQALFQNQWQKSEIEKMGQNGDGDLADDAEKALQLLVENLAKTEQKTESLRAQVEASEQRLGECRAALEKKTGEFVLVESKLNSFREIQSSLAGTKKGVSTFLKQRGDKAFAVLDNLVQTEERYAKGVQLLLREFMGRLVSSGKNADEFIQWLQSKRELGGDLWIPGELCTSDDEVSRDLIPLSKVVRVPSEYSASLRPLLAGHYLTPELDYTAFQAGGQWKAVASFDGTSIIRNHRDGISFECRESSDELQGAVERNNQISRLSDSEQLLSQEISALKQKLAKEQEALENLRVGEREHLEIGNRTRAELVTAQAEWDSRRKHMKALEERKAESKNLWHKLEEEEKRWRQRQSDEQTRLSELSRQYAGQKEKLELCREDYSLKRGQGLAEQENMQSFEEHFQSLKSQIEDVEFQIAQRKAKCESDQKLIVQWRKECDTLKAEIQNLKSSNGETADQLAQKQELLHTAKGELAQLVQRMSEREGEVKTLTQKINQAEKNCFEWETRLNQYMEEEATLTRDLFEKYRVDLRRSIGDFLGYSQEEYQSLADLSGMYRVQTEEGEQKLDAIPYQFSQCSTSELKENASQLRRDRNNLNGIGEVNWQAMEDFERQKKRSDFLKEQERELVQSLKDLDQAIQHIDGKSQERFGTAFARVDECFQKVFPIIFGGGKARLKISGNMDDEDCGVEIVAQPPGKKMQDINLMSGGEKALTALSLIFSIFLVKPSPFCLLDEVDAPLDDVNVGRFNELLREMSDQSQFILITHNKKTMELNDRLYGVTMQEPGVSKAVSVQLH